MAFQMPPLMPHQQLARDFVAAHPHCGVFLGIGGAKTLSTLAALAQVRPAGHILVIAPLAIARSTWLDEIEKWGVPLRTRSLIVDEDDRKLSKEARLQRFSDVPTDPPTMYFVNREMLTQPAQPQTVLELVAAAKAPAGLSQEAVFTMSVMASRGPEPQADLVEAVRDARPLGPRGKRVPKAEAMRWVAELKAAGLAAIVRRDCPSCSGKGCRECRFGLVDQLPTQRVRVNGRWREVPQWPFPTVIIDESQGFKDARSERFKALSRMRPAMTRLIELTGTPTPQSLLDIWSQMYLIDQGASLGSRFTEYRSRYFTPTMHVDGRPVKWAVVPGMETEIYKAISPYVMSAENTTIPLPPVSYDQVNVTLPKDVMAAYKDFAREQVLELASPDPNDPAKLVITADNAAILHGKLIQFASGTMYTDDKHSYQVIHEEKLEMLDHIIGNADGNVLIGYRFRSEREQILAHLAASGRAVEAFDGSRAMGRRWNAGEIEAMVLHPASAGPGLNLQAGGHTLVWYTLSDSLEHYQQLNGRLIRIGQDDHVRIMYLVAKGTRDALTPRSLDMKRWVQEGLLDAVRLDVTPYFDDIEDILGDLDISPL